MTHSIPCQSPQPTPTRKTYPSDLTDAEWELVAPFVAPCRIARPRKYEARCVLNAVLYLVRSGTSWRMLPSDFPPWETVYRHFRRWGLGGAFASLSDTLLSRIRKKGASAKVHKQLFWMLAQASPPVAANP
jgi:transposase